MGRDSRWRAPVVMTNLYGVSQTDSIPPGRLQTIEDTGAPVDPTKGRSLGEPPYKQVEDVCIYRSLEWFERVEFLNGLVPDG